ncbi:MAG: 4-hydroxy-tetrahydrodipicolinate synthase [Bdellovibrionota bacterium]
MNDQYCGVWTALVTPFQQNGQIDWDSFDALLKRQVDAGIKGVVLSGTTGESPTLTVQENMSLVRRAKAAYGDKLLVMGGVGGNNTSQATELARLTSESGADCLLAVTPPYNKPSLAGLTAHYQSLISAQPKPICLYHVPGRTGQKLSPEELSQLAKLPGISMVKEASADIGLFSRSKIKSENEAVFLSGDDTTFLASLAVGSGGVISVLTNIFPSAYVKIYNSFKKGDLDTAIKLHDCLLEFVDILFCEPNPCPTKAVLKHLGLCENIFRLPLVPVDDGNYDRIISCYEVTRTELESL